MTRQVDVKGDGVVNLPDVSLIATAYGSSLRTTKHSPLADLNADVRVNLADASVFASHYVAPVYS